MRSVIAESRGVDTCFVELGVAESVRSFLFDCNCAARVLTHWRFVPYCLCTERYSITKGLKCNCIENNALPENIIVGGETDV